MTWRLTLASSALLILALPGQAVTLHVSKSGDGTDGLSWPTAYTAIGAALAVSATGDEIWVASGTYSESVQMVTGVALFGGFLGTEGSGQFDLRDWEANATIIDATGLRTSAVFGADEALMNGFSIMNASAPHVGGGIRCLNTSPEFINCLISSNRTWVPYVGETCCQYWCSPFHGCHCILYGCPATYYEGRGGGIGLIDSSAIFVSCRITMNYADRGSGLWIQGLSGPLFEDCTFDENKRGASIRILDGASAGFISCDFSRNNSLNSGTISAAFGRNLDFESCTFLNNDYTAIVAYECESIGIYGCRFKGNTNGRHGGGLDLYDARLQIENSSFLQTGGYSAATVSIRSATCIIENATIMYHQSSDNGAAMSFGYWPALVVDDSTITMSGVRIENNYSDSWPAGAAISNSTFVVRDSSFVRNGITVRGDEGGGGLTLDGSTGSMINCLIAENVSRNFFSGVLVGRDSDITLRHCTIANNSGGQPDQAYGLKVLDNSTVLLSDSVIYGNTPENIALIDEGKLESDHSLIERGWPGIGNLDADPLFIDPENHNFRLQSHSPCIDTGGIGEISNDLDGNPRPVDVMGRGVDGPGAFDMGAYEFQLLEDTFKSDLNRDGTVDEVDLLMLLDDIH